MRAYIFCGLLLIFISGCRQVYNYSYSYHFGKGDIKQSADGKLEAPKTVDLKGEASLPLVP